MKKFGKTADQNLEDVVRDSYKSINTNLESRAKTALKILAPGVYESLLIAEFLYKHRETILNTIENVVGIWSDDATPVSDKVIATAGEVIEGGAEIAKEELKDGAAGYIASKFAEVAVDEIEETGAIDTVAKAVSLPQHKERFKELLQGTIEQQVDSTLERTVGDDK